MRIANLMMAALFLFGALVQINDPDPLRWIGIYAAAAVAAFMGNRRPTGITLPAAVGILATLWCALLWSGATVPIFGLFEQWEMRDSAVEESREFYGLAVIALWMITLTVRAVVLRRQASFAARSANPETVS